MEENKKSKTVQQVKSEKRKNLSQSEMPSFTIEEAVKVAQVIWDEFGGKETTPLHVAQALNISPSSSNWRYLSGAAIAYGLTEGGCNAKSISLTSLGRRIVAPTIDNDDGVAIVEAIKQPTLLNQFYTQYGKGSKLPSDSIGENLLCSWGVPKEKAKASFSIIKANGLFSNTITEIKGNLYVQSELAEIPKANSIDDSTVIESTTEAEMNLPENLIQSMNLTIPQSPPIATTEKPNSNKVFITHGKNKNIVEQLKPLLEFGGLEAVVSVERETTAISVPEKVFNDMRTCVAGIIHIEGEKKLIDTEGIEYNTINENVLIEIGAAIALYNKKVILLCKKGTSLPSNLQGLYRCEYDGDKLDYDSTMKLLKTFNEFKKA